MWSLEQVTPDKVVNQASATATSTITAPGGKAQPRRSYTQGKRYTQRIFASGGRGRSYPSDFKIPWVETTRFAGTTHPPMFQNSMLFPVHSCFSAAAGTRLWRHVHGRSRAPPAHMLHEEMNMHLKNSFHDGKRRARKTKQKKTRESLAFAGCSGMGIYK